MFASRHRQYQHQPKVFRVHFELPTFSIMHIIPHNIEAIQKGTAKNRAHFLFFSIHAQIQAVPMTAPHEKNRATTNSKNLAKLLINFPPAQIGVRMGPVWVQVGRRSKCIRCIYLSLRSLHRICVILGMCARLPSLATLAHSTRTVRGRGCRCLPQLYRHGRLRK
jgi:hypothetical protein